MTVSYAGLTWKELRALHKQWMRNATGIKCELGHAACGCSTEASQDGHAPCVQEVVKEFRWRNAAGETVEGEGEDRASMLFRRRMLEGGTLHDGVTAANE